MENFLELELPDIRLIVHSAVFGSLLGGRSDRAFCSVDFEDLRCEI